VVEWSRALDVRLSEWCCSVSMVWVQIPSREEQKFDSSKLSNFCSSLYGIYIINSFGYLLKQCLTVNVVKNWITVVFIKWVRIVVLEKS
jgi:hypothetical protein